VGIGIDVFLEISVYSMVSLGEANTNTFPDLREITYINGAPCEGIDQVFAWQRFSCRLGTWTTDISSVTLGIAGIGFCGLRAEKVLNLL